MLAQAAIISVGSGLGYLLPALIGLESMGVPSPGETALILAAVLASQGKLSIELVIAIAAASAILGDNLGYLLGRHFGRDVLEGRGPFQQRRIRLVRIGDRYFADHGAKTVFIGRWIALIRFATAWLAGINGMRFRTFFFWNAAGGITWAITYGVIGYYGGNAVAHVLERAGIVAAILIAVAIVVFLIARKLRERRAERAAEAKLDPPEPGPPPLGAADGPDRSATLSGGPPPPATSAGSGTPSRC
jgi:membrane protein DedA with SNARE-associated domain